MNKTTKIPTMKRIILSILCSTLLFTASCEAKRDKLKVYATTEQKGYCYENDGLWYIFLWDNALGQYSYQGTQAGFTGYDSSTTVNWSPSSETVSNFSENESALAESISESTGEATGGSEASSDGFDSSTDSGISESSGSDAGGSDSGGGDSGGGDGGGGGE